MAQVKESAEAMSPTSLLVKARSFAMNGIKKLTALRSKNTNPNVTPSTQIRRVSYFIGEHPPDPFVAATVLDAPPNCMRCGTSRTSLLVEWRRAAGSTLRQIFRRVPLLRNCNMETKDL